MTRHALESLDRLLQTDVIEEWLPNVGKQQWQPLYQIADKSPELFSIWCALLDDDAAAKAMERDTWDLSIGDGRPGFSQGWPKGVEETTYRRFGGSEGVRPLIIARSFHGAFEDYLEIDEEFRLYHDLAEDRSRGLLLTFDRSGREVEVARTKARSATDTSESIEVRLKYLREFQAGTRLHLAIYVDSVRYSPLKLSEVPKDERDKSRIAGSTRWHRYVDDDRLGSKTYATFSRLLGKVVLAPPSLDRAGIWPFDGGEKEPTVSFVIGVDSEGQPVEHTSNENFLGDSFGGNREAPHYLTPVFFRREVLAKYFAEPNRYQVTDGQLSCLSLWSCAIDNNLEAHVAVFLGDLGRDLPYEERLHWRQFNIPPEKGLSETNIRRSFLAQWAGPNAVDLVFRREYARLNQEWASARGWPLFLLPGRGDEHLLDTVRVPVTGSQPEVDEQVAHLAKLLVDFLNEAKLESEVGRRMSEQKGIGKFEMFLVATGFPDSEATAESLRDLQALRSTGSAHRKGKKYSAAVKKFGEKPGSDLIRMILERMTAVMKGLRKHYCDGIGHDD